MKQSLKTSRVAILATLLAAFSLTSCTVDHSSGITKSPVEGSTLSAAASDKGTYGDRHRARLIDREGKRIGHVSAWQGRLGVLLEIEAMDLPPGGHGLHLHQRGDCSDLGVFKASEGHISHNDTPHGFLHPEGTHAGDLPNLYVASDGRARADMFIAEISLSDLTDGDGAAIIIHAARDDYQTQPIGRAGTRVACAAFLPRSQ